MKTPKIVDISLDYNTNGVESPTKIVTQQTIQMKEQAFALSSSSHLWLGPGTMSLSTF